MRRGKLIVASLAVTLSGCNFLNWLDLPSVGNMVSLGDSPRASNPAIEACRQQARAQKLDTVGEDQVMPSSDGRYRIVLEIESDDGYSHATCDFDPAKGVEIKLPEPPPKPPDVAKDSTGSDSDNKDASGSENSESAAHPAAAQQPAATTEGTPPGPPSSGPSGPSPEGAGPAGPPAGPTGPAKPAPANDSAGPRPAP